MSGSPNGMPAGVEAGVEIHGTVIGGRGEAVGFTGLDWVRRAFVAQLGIDPFPGTLNLRLDDETGRARWAEVQRWPAIVVRPPDPAWCDAWCYPATIADRIPAAIVRPAVDGYPEDQIELVAALGVRAALGLRAGDGLRIAVHRPARGTAANPA